MEQTSKSVVSTPSSSPGLFSPTANPIRQHIPALHDGLQTSPYLHPLQMHKVRETHKAQVEHDQYSGRKLINQYEIINEIGRGMHGKVKLARSLETGEYVAIKIIQRFSKKRKLGKVTVSPVDKTKREIAILKKIRHANVVGLLEIIDDPELKKIYMVLEHVELGEINWRKKGAPKICLYERRRIEKEQRGEKDTGDDEKYFKMIERRRQRSRLTTDQGHTDFWSLEHGADEEEGMSSLSRQTTHESLENLSRARKTLLRSLPGSRDPSRTPSRACSGPSTRAHTPLPIQMDIGALDSDNEDDEPGPLPSIGSNHGSASALDGTYYGSYPDEPISQRGRSPSMADSIISHMSSIDDAPHDFFEDDFSYVPCFTIRQARESFRETVLGLEYLHYEGIVHRDIKPANLLWTREHHVKISDFGVSYFGRPIREGETEENISEADATDFDNDLELAKTVGTPAFYAPELCYTDEDVEPPKVTEQIDVWSLGVTLYCLIYARLPFLAEDEWQLFRCIAKTEVYIPRKRLMAVDPNCSTPQLRPAGHRPRPCGDESYREENELLYEEIDDELHDLLRSMLKKDPLERIRLREVKRHPWVLRHLPDIIGWLDDTDPSRRTAGRRIQVDNNELDQAVVPITFLERARSAMKKTINKVIGVTKSEGSRRRAQSSATSSGTDTRQHTPLTPTMRDQSRRSSLRGDDSYFASVIDFNDHCHPTEHPLSQSVVASPDIATWEGNPFAQDFAQPSPVGKPPNVPSGTPDPNQRPGPPDRTISTAASIQTIFHRGHSHSRSVTTPTRETMTFDDRPTSPLFTDHTGALFGGHLWSPRGREAISEEEGIMTRAHSVDRSLFASENKHAEPSVSISTVTAPGLFQHPLLYHPKPISRSADMGLANDYNNGRLPSPMFFSHELVNAHQQGQSQSAPNVRKAELAASNIEDRPSTAERTPEGRTPMPRTYGSSTPESFQRAKVTADRRRRLEAEEEGKREALVRHMATPTDCPPSPDDDALTDVMEQKEATNRARSYSSVNSGYLTSQMTSPTDDLTSPLSSVNLGSKDQFEQFFPSVPSLPALVSGASSVSADTEGDMLAHPGVVHDSSPETLTPPSYKGKDHGSDRDGTTPMATQSEDPFFFSPEDEEGYNGDGDTPARREVVEDDSDDDSDEGLVMTRRKPKKQSTVTTMPKREVELVRRNTNGSTGSAGTAKKVDMDL